MTDNDANLYINHIDYYLPSKELSIDDLLSDIDEKYLPPSYSTKEKYSDYVHKILKVKHVREETELIATEMLDILLKRNLESTIDKEKVDLVIIANELNDELGSYGQDLLLKYGLKNADCFCFSGHQCVNVEAAVNLCSNLISNGGYENIMVLAVSKKASLNERIIDTFGIYGDAAGLILLSSQAGKINWIGNNIEYSSKFTDSKLSFLSLGNEIINNVESLLKRFNINVEDISKVLVQNANTLLLKYCLKQLKFSDDMIFDENHFSYGHLNQVDFIVNVKDFYERQSSNNSIVLNIGLGWNGTKISTLLKI